MQHFTKKKKLSFIILKLTDWLIDRATDFKVTVKNKHLFTPNNEIHKYKTRNNTNLHLPTVNITKFYKGPYISGAKAFNHLPRHIEIFANDMKSFKTSLKSILHGYNRASMISVTLLSN